MMHGIDIRSSWTVVDGYAWPLGTAPAWACNPPAPRPPPRPPAKRGPKPDPTMADARLELRRRAIERAATRRRATGQVKQ